MLMYTVRCHQCDYLNQNKIPKVVITVLLDFIKTVWGGGGGVVINVAAVLK